MFSPSTTTPKTTFLTVLPWGLAAGVGVMLLLQPPQNAILTGYTGYLAVYALLTAVALMFGVLLNEDEFSAAHVIGLVAFLSLPAQVGATMTWAICLGGVIGGGVLIVRAKTQHSTQRRTATRLRDIAFIPARVTLSFVVANQFYRLLHGDLPIKLLSAGSENLWARLAQVGGYGLVYTLLYFSITLLELYSDGRPVKAILASNLGQIILLLVLPVPFAVLGAEFASYAAPSAFILLVVVAALVLVVLNNLSYSQYRLRKQLDELKSLSVVTQAMRAHLNLNGLLTTIYVQVAHLLDAENFVVALYNTERKELDFPLVIRQGVQDDATKHQANLNTALLDHVLGTLTPVLISDEVSAQSEKLGLRPPRELIYSWLGVPLLVGGRALGAIVVTSYDPHQHFTPDHLRLLNIVAASASIAIENAQLYREQTERAEQLVTLNKISALLSGTLSPDTVLDTIISSASALTKSSAVAVHLFWDEAKNKLVLVRSAGFSENFSSAPPKPLMRIDEPAAPEKLLPVVINDVHKDRRTLHLRTQMSAEGKAAWIELPLAVGDNLLGVLAIYFNQPQVFSGESVEFMRTFTNQAAQAINNARVYTRTDEALERRVEQLFALAAIGRLLTMTMDVRKISDLVLTYATDATKAGVGLVALRDESTLGWAILAQRGYTAPALADPSVLIQNGSALKSNQPLRVADIRQTNEVQPLVPTSRSTLIVPLSRGKEIIGVIRLENDGLNAFSEEDSYFVGQIANQAVIALDNLRLFSRITEARDRLQVLLNTMEEAILLIDSSGRVALANPRVTLLGLIPEQILNQGIETLLDDAELNFCGRVGCTSSEELHELVKTLQTHSAWQDRESVSYTLPSEHGSLYIQRQVIPVRDEKGAAIGMLLVFYNKTQEQQLIEAREELSQMIVHDLRSPLTAVTTSLRLLKELVPPDSDFSQVVKTTTEASQRAIRKLLARVDALLDVARMESGELSLDTEPTELATLADTVCVELSPLAHELNVIVVSEIGDKFPLLNIDGDKVERVLLNLVDNALKYSPSDSRIAIRAHQPGTAGAPEHFVRVEVVDQGPGIPDNYKERLFERFVQVEGRKKMRRGVGLGLTFCRLVAEAHGGRIWIEDNPGGGSVFAFMLPVVRQDLLIFDE